jgi:hypothetical protein
MSTPRNRPDPIDDIEKPHSLAVEPASDGPSAPLTVRLRDPWSDFLRVADKPSDADAPQRSPSALPLLDAMKGILQWD